MHRWRTAPSRKSHQRSVSKRLPQARHNAASPAAIIPVRSQFSGLPAYGMNTTSKTSVKRSSRTPWWKTQQKRDWLDYVTLAVAGVALVVSTGAASFSGIQAWIARDTEQRQLLVSTNPVSKQRGACGCGCYHSPGPCRYYYSPKAEPLTLCDRVSKRIGRLSISDLMRRLHSKNINQLLTRPMFYPQS